MKAFLASDQSPMRVIYREEGWPEHLYNVREAGPEDSGLPVVESLFRTKDGKPHPLLPGYLDPHFLKFRLYRPLLRD